MKNTVIALAVVSVSAALMAGCSASSSSVATTSTTSMSGTMAVGGATQPAVALSKEEKAARAEWWYGLARKGAVTNDEATRGVLMHLDDAMASAPYRERVAYLQGKGMWPKWFDGTAGDHVTRGDLAVAFCKILKLEGGLNTAILGATPRYCTRTLIFEGFYPESTPNQAFSGAEFVGIIGASDDRRRGDPSNFPAEKIPGYVEEQPKVAVDGSPVLDYHKLPLIVTEAERDYPVDQVMYLQQPAAAVGETKLRVFITAVQGDQAQYRENATAAWKDAEEGIEVSNTAEFRTGDKSSIRFNIPPGQTFTLDRLGSCTIAEAVQLGNKVKTNVAVEQGRLRMDVNETAPAIKAKIEKVDANTARIAEAGVIHETSIRSPNSALAVRGTKVSLLDQPPYAPRAVSLTGRAEYMNLRHQIVALGGQGSKSTVEGNQTGAAQNAAFAAAPKLPSAVLAASYDLAQQNRVLATGGFIRGDVIVGNAGLEAGKAFTDAPFGFVLGFGSPGSTTYEDLNLGVITPLSTKDKPDFIANGPFTGSLDPSRPGYDEYRATYYPKVTADGSGTISKNAVSVPERLAVDKTDNSTAFRATEFAIFDHIERGGTGKYLITVTNFVDVPDGVDVPGKGSNPVPAVLQVIVNGKTQTIAVDGQRTFSVGLYETKVIEFDTDLIPESAFSAVPNSNKKISKSKLAALQRAQNRATNALIAKGAVSVPASGTGAESVGTLAGDSSAAAVTTVKGKKKG